MSQVSPPRPTHVVEISPSTVRTRTYQRLLDRFEELVRGGASSGTANILDYYLSLVDLAAAARSRDGATALRQRALSVLLDTASDPRLSVAARQFAVDRARPWLARLRHSPWTRDEAALQPAAARLRAASVSLRQAQQEPRRPANAAVGGAD